MTQLVEPSVHSMISEVESLSKVDTSLYIIQNATMKAKPDKVMMKQNATKPRAFDVTLL